MSSHNELKRIYSNPAGVGVESFKRCEQSFYVGFEHFRSAVNFIMLKQMYLPLAIKNKNNNKKFIVDPNTN